MTAVRVGGAVGLGGDEDLTQRIEHEATLTHSHPSTEAKRRGRSVFFRS